MIMTTNAGAARLDVKPAMGLRAAQQAATAMTTRRSRKRFTRGVQQTAGRDDRFRSMKPEVMACVVEKFIIHDRRRDKARRREHVQRIRLDDGARWWLSKKGFDPLFGARTTVPRVIRNTSRSVAEELTCSAKRWKASAAWSQAQNLRTTSWRLDTEPPADQEPVKEQELGRVVAPYRQSWSVDQVRRLTMGAFDVLGLAQG